MNDFDQMRIRCEKLATENESLTKTCEKLLEDLTTAHKEAEAFARGYVELGKKFVSGDFGERLTNWEIVRILCNKFEEIENTIKTLKTKET